MQSGFDSGSKNRDHHFRLKVPTRALLIKQHGPVAQPGRAPVAAEMQGRGETFNQVVASSNLVRPITLKSNNAYAGERHTKR